MPVLASQRRMLSYLERPAKTRCRSVKPYGQNSTTGHSAFIFDRGSIGSFSPPHTCIAMEIRPPTRFTKRLLDSRTFLAVTCEVLLAVASPDVVCFCPLTRKACLHQTAKSTDLVQHTCEAELQRGEVRNAIAGLRAHFLFGRSML